MVRGVRRRDDEILLFISRSCSRYTRRRRCPRLKFPKGTAATSTVDEPSGPVEIGCPQDVWIPPGPTPLSTQPPLCLVYPDAPFLISFVDVICGKDFSRLKNFIGGAAECIQRGWYGTSTLLAFFLLTSQEPALTMNTHFRLVTVTRLFRVCEPTKRKESISLCLVRDALAV